MSLDLFQISRGRGVYHTISLWAMLSPRLVSNLETRKSDIDRANAQPADETGEAEPEVDSPSPALD